METVIKIIHPDGVEERPVAQDRTQGPGSGDEVPGRNGAGGPLLTVEVTVVPGGRDPAPVRRSDSAYTEATRSAREEDTLEAEDVLTQAEEANALDPVG